MMRIYVASSWRNKMQPDVVAALRRAGHEVYDFRNPEPGNKGFSWAQIDTEWLKWTPEQFRLALSHDHASHGFACDIGALIRCDACVLALPCGRSAHLELGYAAGLGKWTCIYAEHLSEPELMYNAADYIAINTNELVQWAAKIVVIARSDEKWAGHERNLSVDERFRWGECPVCRAADGEPCRSHAAVQLVFMRSERALYNAVHEARLEKAPLRVREFPV